MKKKIMSLLAISIVVVMCFANYAKNITDWQNIRTITEANESGDVDVVKFGSYPVAYLNDTVAKDAVPILWMPLEINEDENYALLLTCNAVDAKPYNDSYLGSAWDSCSLRKWLNEDFYNIAFNDNEKSQILNNKREFLTDLQGASNSTKVYGECEDKVSLLSIKECDKYGGKYEYIDCYKKLDCCAESYAKSNARQAGFEMCDNDNLLCDYWLIDSKQHGNLPFKIDKKKYLTTGIAGNNRVCFIGVRPVIKIKLN